MDCQGTFADDNSSSVKIIPKKVMAVLPISMTIHIIHIALLLRVMAKEGPIWKRAINWMILSDEVIRFLGSVGAIHVTTVLGMWEGSKENISDCNSHCCIFVFFCILGMLWNIIGGSGCQRLLNFIPNN